MTTENNLSENEEQKPSTEVQETVETIENTEENHQEEDSDAHHHDSIADLSLADALKEMEKIINSPNAGERFREFNVLKEKANHSIHDEVEDKKHEYTDAGNALENFSYEHPSQSKLSGLIHIFREKHDHFQKNQEEEQKKNLDHRQSIIDRLKNLYTNSEPGVNLFKSIREIKEEWSNSGQVAKSESVLSNVGFK